MPPSTPSPRLSHPRWSRIVFSVGATHVQWLDVVLAAMVRGEWRELECRLADGLACAIESRQVHARPAASRVNATAAAFRQERDLVTPGEMIEWLQHEGVSLAAWKAFLERRLLRDDWVDQLPALATRHGHALAVTEEDLLAEGVCSGDFDRMARVLAGQAALVAATPDAASASEPVDPLRVEALRAAHGSWLSGYDTADLRQRVTTLMTIDARFEIVAAAAVSEWQLAGEVVYRQLDWTRVHLERISFDTLDAAREAIGCVRWDGLALPEIAAASHRTIRDTRALLDELDPALRDAVRSAANEDVVGPVDVGGRYEVVRMLGRASPDLEDAHVRARATGAVVDRLVTKALRRHVQWVDLSNG